MQGLNPSRPPSFLVYTAVGAPTADKNKGKDNTSKAAIIIHRPSGRQPSRFLLFIKNFIRFPFSHFAEAWCPIP